MSLNPGGKRKSRNRTEKDEVEGFQVWTRCIKKILNFNVDSFSWQNYFDILFLVFKECCCFWVSFSIISYDPNQKHNYCKSQPPMKMQYICLKSVGLLKAIAFDWKTAVKSLFYPNFTFSLCFSRLCCPLLSLIQRVCISNIKDRRKWIHHRPRLIPTGDPVTCGHLMKKGGAFRSIGWRNRKRAKKQGAHTCLVVWPSQLTSTQLYHPGSH